MVVSIDLSHSPTLIYAPKFVQGHFFNLKVFLREAPAALKNSGVAITFRPGVTVANAAIKLDSQNPMEIMGSQGFPIFSECDKTPKQQELSGST